MRDDLWSVCDPSTSNRSTRPQPADILVVDDTPANLRLLMEILLKQGYRVRPVTDGALAITAAQRQPPDLVLLDIKMPGMDGYEVCQALKSDERTHEVPIVFLTVLDEAVDKVKGFALGGVEYITKPFDATELLARVENQLRLRSLQTQLIEQNQKLQDLLEQYRITEMALRESEDKFSKAFQNSPLPITISALPEGRYLDVNREFSGQIGYPRDKLIGYTTMELNLWVDPKDRTRLLEQIKTHGYVRGFETRLRAKSGAILEVRLFIEIIQLDGLPYLLTTGEDITMRNAAKKKLAARTQELAKTLETLQTTQAQLIQSAKMAALGRLVAGVAHEINTPVGTAIMMASTLENSTKTITADVAGGTLTQTAFQNYLEVATDASHLILENLNRAGELVQSFKQVAVDQTNLKDRTFAVKPYLQEVIINLTPQLKHTSHTVTLTGDDTLMLHSYPGALSQVITNLVINSITHGFSEDRPGHICIDVQQQDSQCVLNYSDDGVGISPENLDQIFDPFFTTAHHRGGSGLGLHLVYNLIIERLQGEIEVTSEVGEGTTFTVTLPTELKIEIG